MMMDIGKLISLDKDRMNTYITTDSHFNHERVKEYCGRPENYESIIWSELYNLTEEHLLIHLGDICWYDNIEIHKKIAELRCRKVLVRGNHDKKSDHWYLEHGWDFVCDTFQITRHKKKVLFSHKPRAWDGYFDINIHGHLHNSQHNMGNNLLGIQRHGQYLVCIEDLNYKLIKLDTILKEA